MLKKRVLTALLLLIVLIPTVIYRGYLPLAVVAMVFIAAASWEWAHLNLFEHSAVSYASAILSSVLCGFFLYFGWVHYIVTTLWICISLVWILLSFRLLLGGVPAWNSIPPLFRLVGGLLGFFVTWLAVVQAHISGIEYLLSVLSLVWATDIGGYFIGRALGGRYIRRKLAVTVSPGKTWEGAIGGVLGALVLSVLWFACERSEIDRANSLFSRLYTNHGLWWMLGGVFTLSTLSIVGDLLESLVKRAAGVKDSSNLLPGHGGVLDRIDALLPVLPAAIGITQI